MDQQRLDKLVDGELAEVERRELLASLDNQPDGWRRCALAFLEAQWWRKELASFAGGTLESPVLAKLAKQQTSREGRLVKRKLAVVSAAAVAMAASFLASLWLGWVVQDSIQTVTIPAPNPGGLAKSTPRPQVAIPVVPQAPEPQERLTSPGGPWQMVTLSPNAPDGRTTETIMLPACDRHRLDSHWPASLPSALPREVMESLERSGYRVRHHRELMPIEMQDGRRLIVPIEEVEVQYVGQPPL